MSIKIDPAGIARLAEFFRACNYRIQEVTQFLWDCYGRHAIIVDAIYEQRRPPKFAAEIGASAQMIIDKRTQEVFEISCADSVKNAAWKWYNPAYSLVHDLEASRRGIDQVDQAWDEVNYKRTTEAAVLKKIRTLFNPPIKKRKPKKKVSAARGKLVKPGQRKKTVRRR